MGALSQPSVPTSKSDEKAVMGAIVQEQGGVAGPVVRTTPSGSGPWCWAEKSALRLITDRCGENSTSPTVRSVYIALCELASDYGENFTAAKALIASKAGVSIKTAARALKDLSDLGLVQIISNAGLKQPNEYQLVSMRHGDPSIRHELKQGQKTDKVEERERKKQKLSAPGRRAERKPSALFRAGAVAPRRESDQALPENCNF